MDDLELQQLKSQFKKLFGKNPDENLSAFLSYINSVKIDSLKIILLQLKEEIKNSN